MEEQIKELNNLTTQLRHHMQIMKDEIEAINRRIPKKLSPDEEIRRAKAILAIERNSLKNKWSLKSILKAVNEYLE